MRGRTIVYVAIAIGILAVAGLLTCWLVFGDPTATIVAAIVAAFAEVVAVTLAIYGAKKERSKQDSQVVVRSATGGGITQIRGVANVKIRGSRTSGVPIITGDSRPAEGPQRDPQGQAVIDSAVARHIRQIEDVNGTVDINDEP